MRISFAPITEPLSARYFNVSAAYQEKTVFYSNYIEYFMGRVQDKIMNFSNKISLRFSQTGIMCLGAAYSREIFCRSLLKIPKPSLCANSNRLWGSMYSHAGKTKLTQVPFLNELRIEMPYRLP